ncbi:MAG: metallopeptidase TldD-related protein [Candidatus Cloacimonadales bacterium]|jgi:predicted Zn-dependent protease|nr:TldD/PmbA family protein [Candidatus Cloacimonadota bacterium]MDD2650068.1 metallopeptidase TldD-related protein [Candidatus Cloacimonadota bacterium]MDX9977133.1 metallopeptidase TldD-related protein [Candidatus Cloacimonadales bacterium]
MQVTFKESLLEIIAKNPDYKFLFSYSEWETDFLRFYRSQTNYNISKKAISLDTTMYKGKKSLSFSITNPNIEILAEKIEDAMATIDALPEDPDFVDIETDTRKADERIKTNNIEQMSLEKKINYLKKLADAVEPYKFKIFGTFICNYEYTHLITSNGLDKVMRFSPIYFETKAVSDENEVTVLEAFGSENAEGFDIDEVIRNIIGKIQIAQSEVIDVEPGEYEVILAPRCIGEYIGYYMGSCSAGSLDRKNTLLEGKIGEQVFPANFTLIDDPKNPMIVNYDYNSEGHLYEKTPIFENGVFKNFLVGSYYANKLGMEKNGAQASCLVMSTGDRELEEMIKSTKKGLFISSLHYMNFINPKESSITGLTRDGTFLIEDGKLTKVVNNLRFTVKISDVINNITEIENKAYTFPQSDNYGQFSISASSMPHVKVKSFNISSSTKTV